MNPDARRRKTSGARVLALSVDAVPRIGGIANFAHFCTSELASTCTEVVFVGPTGTGLPNGGRSDYTIVEDAASRQAVRSGTRGLLELPRIESFLTTLVERHALNQVFLYHPFYYGPAATSVAERLSIPCDVVIHGTELASQFPEALSPGHDIEACETDSLKFLLMSTLRRASRVVANSSYTGDLVKRIVPDATVVVSGCGLSAETLAAARARATPDPMEKSRRRSALGGTKRPQLCFVGRLVRHKRVDRIFALQRAMGADLVVVGDGPLREALQDQAVAAGVSDAVQFFGTVSDEEKWGILATSDFLILPSEFDDSTGGYEGFGIVLLEAIASGTIPVCSGTYGTADPVHEHGLGLCGLVADADVHETAARMKRLLSCPDAYRRKVERDSTIVERHFLWSRVAERITRGWRHE